MTSVTGHDSISERNMALRLTALKSAQRALSPVRLTEMPGRDRWWSRTGQRVGGGTMALGSPLAPPVITPVLPFAESDTPGWGGTTTDTRGSALQQRGGLAHHSPSSGIGGDGARWSTTTTCRAVAPRPPKLFLDDLPGLDRLAGRVLPAGPGQGVLDLGGEGAEERPAPPPRPRARPEGGWRSTPPAGPCSRREAWP